MNIEDDKIGEIPNGVEEMGKSHSLCRFRIVWRRTWLSILMNIRHKDHSLWYCDRCLKIFRNNPDEMARKAIQFIKPKVVAQ